MPTPVGENGGRRLSFHRGYRGYRRRRYSYSGRRNQSAPRRAEVSRLYRGIDDDVREFFFALDAFTLKLVFNVYEREFGGGARRYAEATFAKWRSGNVQMGGEISERLIGIVPEFLGFQQKYDLIEELWNRFRQRATLSITISPDRGIEDAIATVMGAVKAVDKHEIPSAVAERVAWLADDDSVAAQTLLAEVTRREGEIAVQSLRQELCQLSALARQQQSKHVSAKRTVTLPSTTVCIQINQEARTRRSRMSEKDESTPPPGEGQLARRGDADRQRELAPIQDPTDLLGEALRRMSPRKQEEIIGKATDEALSSSFALLGGMTDESLHGVDDFSATLAR